MNRRAAVAALAVPTLLVVGGCAPLRQDSADGSTDHSSSSQHASKDKPSPAASTPSPMLTPTARAGTSLGTGERVWAAFSERGLSQEDWWAQLKPMLSDSAQAVYVYDDPRNLPQMKLTGKLTVASKAPDDPRYTAEVVVPTSKGVFRLDLERHTRTSPYLLYAITFPPGVK